MYGIAGFLIGLMYGMIVFVILFGIAVYLLSAFGLYTRAVRLNIDYPWLAFIPIASAYLQGRIAEEVSSNYEGSTTKFAVLLLVLAIVTMAFSWIPILGLIIDVVYIVYWFITLYKVYKYTSSNYVTLLVLSIIFIVIVPFVLFFTRNSINENLMSNGKNSNNGGGQSGQNGNNMTPITEPVAETQNTKIVKDDKELI